MTGREENREQWRSATHLPGAWHLRVRAAVVLPVPDLLTRVAFMGVLFLEPVQWWKYTRQPQQAISAANNDGTAKADGDGLGLDAALQFI